LRRNQHAHSRSVSSHFRHANAPGMQGECARYTRSSLVIARLLPLNAPLARRMRVYRQTRIGDAGSVPHLPLSVTPVSGLRARHPPAGPDR
jgi:hypothetical protein